MAEFYTLITDAGREAVAQAVANGTTVDITHFAVGDGGGQAVYPAENWTALVNEKWRGLVATYKPVGSSLFINLYIPVEEASFTIRELGVFTADGVLFAVCNTPDMDKILPSDGAISSFSFSIKLDVSNIETGNIVVQADPELDFIPTSEKGQPNGVAELDENGKVLKSQLPDGILSAKMSVYYNGGA